jgi:hypothetical protein
MIGTLLTLAVIGMALAILYVVLGIILIIAEAVFNAISSLFDGCSPVIIVIIVCVLWALSH